MFKGKLSFAKSRRPDGIGMNEKAQSRRVADEHFEPEHNAAIGHLKGF